MEKKSSEQNIYELFSHVEALYVFGTDVTERKLLFCRKNGVDWTKEALKLLDREENRQTGICGFFLEQVAEEDKEKVKKFYTCEGFLRAYEEKRTEQHFNFHIRTKERPVWVTATAHLLRNPENGHIMALHYIKETDDETRVVKLQKERQRVNGEIITLLSKLFFCVLEINLTKDCYGVLKHSADFEKFSLPEKYSEALKFYAQAVVAREDRVRVLKVFSIEALKERIQNGSPEFEEQCHWNLDGKYRWVSINAMAETKEEDGDIRFLFFLRDIQEEKETEIEREKVNLHYGLVIANSYVYVREIDLQRDRTYVIYYDVDGLHKDIWHVTHASEVERVVKMVHPEDKELYLSFMQKENMEKRFSLLHPQENFTVRKRASEEEEYRYYNYSLQRVEWNRQVAYMLYVKDVTLERRADERQRQLLREAVLAAENANHAKTDFLAKMSHDIRTPLNAVIGMTAIAQESLEDMEQVKGCLEKISVSSKHLLGLINDILDMSRIENNQCELLHENFSISELVKNVTAMISAQAEEKQQQFQVSMLDVESEYLVGDGMRLSQILLNVLNNAVKYTPNEGSIHFEVIELEQRCKNHAHFQFVVVDNGIGMSEEFQGQMFKPFTRERSMEMAGVEGTGLGLTITKNLVDMMNGTIEVESRQGAGCKISIHLDIERQDTENIGKAEQPAVQGKERKLDCKGKRILVVEDNAVNLEIIRVILTRGNAQVDAAVNGEEAVRRFVESAPDYYSMILMDIQMPVMDGYEASRRIRASLHPDARWIPIIATSANVFPEDILASKAAGMSCHIGKPINLEELKSVMEEYL